MRLLAVSLVLRILIQNYVLKSSPVPMVDDVFRVVLDEEFLDFADVLQMCCVELYLLVVVKRALSTELIGTGVVVEAVLIIGLRGKRVLVGIVFLLARTCVLICFFQEIYIKRCVFFLN